MPHSPSAIAFSTVLSRAGRKSSSLNAGITSEMCGECQALVQTEGNILCAGVGGKEDVGRGCLVDLLARSGIGRVGYLWVKFTIPSFVMQSYLLHRLNRLFIA